MLADRERSAIPLRRPSQNLIRFSVSGLLGSVREGTISRAAVSLTYPARFMLAAAMNPCPCGYHGDAQRKCSCPPQAVQRYLARVSGPLPSSTDR
jgi:hypothetical protein